MTQPIRLSFWLSEKAYDCLQRLSPLDATGHANKDSKTGFVQVSVYVNVETSAYFTAICLQTGTCLDDLMEAFYLLAEENPQFRSQALNEALAIKKAREAKQ